MFCELVVHTFPQEVGCTVQPAWILLLLSCRGCSSSVMCYMVMDLKGGGKEPKKAGLGSAMKPLSIVFFHPKVNDAGACVQKVAPAARACRQLLLVRPSRAGTTSSPGTPSLIRGLSLLKGSQPFKLVTKPVLSLPSSRPLSPRV